MRLNTLLAKPDGLGDSCVGRAIPRGELPQGQAGISPRAGVPFIRDIFRVLELGTGQKRIAEALILSTPRSIDISGTAYALTCCPDRSLSDEIRICMASVGPSYIITHYIPSCPLLCHHVRAHRLDDGTLSLVSS